MSEKNNNLLDGLILGGLIGAVLGLLFAPEAGENTRQQLKAKLQEFNLGEIVDRFSEAFSAGREEADKVLNEVEGK